MVSHVKEMEFPDVHFKAQVFTNTDLVKVAEREVSDAHSTI